MIFRRIEARVAAAAGRAAERRADAIATAARTIPGITVERDEGRVVLQGHEVVRRSIDDPVLRFAGRAR